MRARRRQCGQARTVLPLRSWQTARGAPSRGRLLISIIGTIVLPHNEPSEDRIDGNRSARRGNVTLSGSRLCGLQRELLERVLRAGSDVLKRDQYGID